MGTQSGELAFAVCNVGSEAWLVREVARLAPGSAAAYRRKGLVTFKVPGDAERALEGSVFARVHGRSLGLVGDVEPALALLEVERGPLCLQVFARDAEPEGPEAAEAERAAQVELALRAGLGERAREGAVARPGERVVSVIVAAARELVVGVRTQGEQGWRAPGGRVPVDVPSEAPSRAYAKLEEALRWSGLRVRPGEVAVELGSAPGGASYALLRRGVHVTGVDPAAMHERVLAYVGPSGARLTHLAMPAGALRREHVPKGASLLVCDANLAPPVALRAVGSVARWMGRSLRAAVLTLKLNDERMVDALPSLLERVRALGLRVQATQLPSNRREICVVGTRA